MKTLLFTFPSKGGSTSVWHFLKCHPDVHPSKKKFMNTSDGSEWYWSGSNGMDHWRIHPPSEYYGFMKAYNYDDGVWLDGTDDILDKDYLSLLRIKLKEFDRFCAIYTIRDPFKWSLAYYVFFRIAEHILVENRKLLVENVIKKQYTVENVLKHKDFYINDFIRCIPSYYKDFTHLFKKFNQEDIYIDYLEDIFNHQEDIFSWLNIDNTVCLNEFPHVNNTTSLMKRIFGSDDAYNVWKDLVYNDSRIHKIILDDCKRVEKRYEIDLIDHYNLMEGNRRYA